MRTCKQRRLREAPRNVYQPLPARAIEDLERVHGRRRL